MAKTQTASNGLETTGSKQASHEPSSETPPHPLEKIIGIFKDEPLMDALMERVRKDRDAEIEALSAD